MIRSTKNVLIDSNIQEIGKVYLQVKDPRYKDSIGQVHVDVEYYKEVENKIKNQEGQEVIKKSLQLYYRTVAIFKRTTWSSTFGNVNVEDYDARFISTIELVNNFERTNTWSPTVAQRISYFAKPVYVKNENNEYVELNNLRGSDFEIVTPQILINENLL